MSNANPHAPNGYSSTNAANSNPGRYGGLYTQHENPSSHSVNSLGPRERRGLDETTPPRSDEANPQPLLSRTGNDRVEDLDWRQKPRAHERRISDIKGHDRRNMANGNQGYIPYSPKRNVKSMEEVIQHIRSGWSLMAGDECVPVQVALKLMDPSSLGFGDREADFQQTHAELQKTLKSIVNEHHQDFNSSIGTYHKIQSSIQASQSRVRYLKSALAGAQLGLLTTKPELKGLATSSQDLDDTLQLFGQIEDLQSVPEKLEARISDKRFLTAVDILQDSLRLVRKSELCDIGAIADLRTYFVNQEQSLTDILIEELHDHLYLKSPYCQDRWKAKSTAGEEKDLQASMAASGVNSWDKPVYHYLSNLDTKSPMAEDASRNPEADTFYYIHMIVESLNKLGRLEYSVSRIEQRLPVELYKVVDKTNNDIDAKYPSHLRGLADKEKGHFIPTRTRDGRALVLSDFLWTLYSKFEAIAEGHRVFHEVVAGIMEREHVSKPETYLRGFRELWKLYQMEIRSLLHDYLAADGDMSLRVGLTNADGGDVFARSQRDKNKKIFKLSEVDLKSSGMKSEQDELDEILKTSVPGLVLKPQTSSGIASDSERAGHDNTATGHKLLIEPSVFNMTVLLPPSLSFLQRLREIVPTSSDIAMSTLTSFLDDFLINIFHPQLEEAVTELCTKCIIDLEAFSEDSQWSKYSPRPIFKGAITFMSMIRAFSSMLNSIPQDQIFTQLIISQLVMYYDKCYGWFKSQVSRLSPSPSSPGANIVTLKAGAANAESGDIHDVTLELLKTDLDPATRSGLLDKEVELFLTTTKNTPLTSYDIISDPKSVHALSLLHNSMQWLSASLAQLRLMDPLPSPKSHSRHPSQAQGRQRRWTLISSLKPQIKSPGRADVPIYLPLTTETAAPFDTTLYSFHNLAQTALLTLHIDVRFGVIYQLTRSLRGTPSVPPNQPLSLSGPRDSSAMPAIDSGAYPWVLPNPPTSASPLVLELNNDLISFDTHISTCLGIKERAFITTGLAKLVDKVLVVGAESVQVMNENGAMRMGIDILVLQQNLRNVTATSSASTSATAQSLPSSTSADVGLGITPSSSNSARQQEADGEGSLLSFSAQYYDLFLRGPDQVMAYIKEKKDNEKSGNGAVGYTYDELRTLIELCYSAAMRSKDREESVRARKGLQDCLLQLGECLWDS